MTGSYYFILKIVYWNLGIVKKLGRDEKGCKMDVDGRQRTSTVDQVEKSRMVDVNQLRKMYF